MIGRFCPGDIVQVSDRLPALQDINGIYGEYVAMGSVIFGNREGIVIGKTEDGYRVDFGRYQNGCVLVPEKWLVRA